MFIVNFDRLNKIKSITTLQDAESVLAFMIFDANLIFHPDDSAHDYIDHATKEPAFSEYDANRIDAMMEEAFKVFEAEDKDIYLWSMAMRDCKKESITLQEYDRQEDITDYLVGCKDHTAPCLIASIV